MATRWKIHKELEDKLRREIKHCVYCRKSMKEYPHRKGTPNDKATWEHIDNSRWRATSLAVQKANVVRCCGACNRSKGDKKLAEWLDSEYCKENGIKRSRIKNRQVLGYLAKRTR